MLRKPSGRRLEEFVLSLGTGWWFHTLKPRERSKSATVRQNGGGELGWTFRPSGCSQTRCDRWDQFCHPAIRGICAWLIVLRTLRRRRTAASCSLANEISPHGIEFL